MNEIKCYFKENYQNIIKIFFLFSLLFQVLTYAGYAGKLAHHAKVVGANNNDGEAAIIVAVKTKLLNDNNWFPYGPVYYRVTHVFARLFPFNPHFDDKLNKKESLELNHNFTLIMVSVISLFLLSFVISTIVTKDFVPRILITQIITALLASNHIWARYLLGPHPDMIYALLTIIATITTIKLFRYPKNQKLFIGSGILWGIVASTKLSVILTIPSVIICLLILYKKNYKKIIIFFGWALAGYMAIGFPQNFNIFKSIKFLISQSKYSKPLDWKAFSTWWELYFDQIIYAAIAMIILGFIFGEYKRKTTKEYILIAIITLGPFLTLTSRKIISAFTYYPIPYIALSLLLIAYLIKTIPAPKIKNNYRIFLIPLLILVLFKFFPGFTPKSLAKVQNSLQGCLKESEYIYNRTKQMFNKNTPIVITPYVPYDNRYSYTPLLNYSWNHSFNSIKTTKARALLFKGNFYASYLPKKLNIYSSQHTQDPNATRVFYNAFHNKKSVTDPFGGKWKKTYSDSCSYEIWEKTN